MELEKSEKLRNHLAAREVGALVGIILIITFNVVLFGGIIWIAWHFISKWW
jgi:hypothetical protein